MKAAEAYADSHGVSYLTLMENAASALASAIEEQVSPRSRGLFLCGRGNNGGDGFAAARMLSESGFDVTAALLCGEPQSGIAREEYERLKGKAEIINGKDIDFSAKYSFVCDAVFGTGFHGELPDEVGRIFDHVSDMGAVIFAADIPSGADSSSGYISEHTLCADITVTFGAMKRGMLAEPAKSRCGKVITADIGIGDDAFESIGYVPQLMTAAKAAAVLPERNCYSHKGCFGRLLIIAGCSEMSGAAAMNVTGALRSGAGLVKLASTEKVINRVGSGIYEATFLELDADPNGAISYASMPKIARALENTTVCAVGSGLSNGAEPKRLVYDIIRLCGEKDIPLIIDADGLNCIGTGIDIIRNAECRAVLTPHPGELARLLGTTAAKVTSDRLSAAAELSQRTGAIVAAKGMPTYIVSPDGRAAASYTGNGGLSRGGSGDVLTGVISGICSSNKGAYLFECVCAGVYLFGNAADLAAKKLSMTGMLPSDAAAQLPFAFKNAERLQN